MSNTKRTKRDPQEVLTELEASLAVVIEERTRLKKAAHKKKYDILKNEGYLTTLDPLPPHIPAEVLRLKRLITYYKRRLKNDPIPMNSD